MVDDATQEFGLDVEGLVQNAKPVVLEVDRQAAQVAYAEENAIAWHPAEVVARVPPHASLECTQASGDAEQKP